MQGSTVPKRLPADGGHTRSAGAQEQRTCTGGALWSDSLVQSIGIALGKMTRASPRVGTKMLTAPHIDVASFAENDAPDLRNLELTNFGGEWLETSDLQSVSQQMKHYVTTYLEQLYWMDAINSSEPCFEPKPCGTHKNMYTSQYDALIKLCPTPVNKDRYRPTNPFSRTKPKNWTQGSRLPVWSDTVGRPDVGSWRSEFQGCGPVWPARSRG